MNSADSPKSLGLQETRLVRSQCYIAGTWCDADSRATQTVVNPATGQPLGTVPRMGRAETARAIAAAEAAFNSWKIAPAADRARVLHRWFELLIQHREDLARIMTSEQGKPLAESRGEISYAAGFIEWFAEEAKRTYGETIPAKAVDQRIVVVKEPVGVCAAITPWNFPVAMITRKAGAALAAGCTMVVKCARQTPYSALALAVLAEEAGVPPGVLSVITGSAQEIGAEFTSNAAVRKLTFTGSTDVGRELMRQCAGSIKRVTLELGGNAPFIVFADADLDAAAEGAMASKFRNMGQTCVCANRIYVEEPVYEAFAEKLSERMRTLRVGDGFGDGVTQGPLIDEPAVRKVEEHLADAIAKGAHVKLGGRRHALGGTFFEPTLVTGVTGEMLIAKEETFGPVAPLFRFNGEAEALRFANDTECGLAAYFYTRDLGRTWRVSRGLDYGMIGINTGLVSNEAAPFGGMKESGLGREGSKYGIEAYLEVKCLTFDGL